MPISQTFELLLILEYYHSQNYYLIIKYMDRIKIFTAVQNAFESAAVWMLSELHILPGHPGWITGMQIQILQEHFKKWNRKKNKNSAL